MTYEDIRITGGPSPIFHLLKRCVGAAFRIVAHIFFAGG